MLKYGPKSWKATIYALDDLDLPLLARVACQKLEVVVNVDEIASPERSHGHMKRTHPEVFAGQSCLQEEYEIKLREGSRIPITLLPRVLAEQKRIEDMSVIEKVVQPTEW